LILLSYTNQALAFLLDLEAKQHRQVNSKILKLLQNTRPSDSEKLDGYRDLYRVDIGEFRIAYKYDDRVLYVLLIARRNDDHVYKLLSRK
jgi:mRNA interferase RelE/StbE